MEMLAVGLSAVGIIVSWLASRHYYLKSRPERTLAQALVATAHRDSLLDSRIDPPKSSRTPLKWVLELIRAFEDGRIYTTELEVCVKTIDSVAALLRQPIKDAQEAAVHAGQTLTPAWQAAYRDVLRDKLAEVKAQVETDFRQSRS